VLESVEFSVRANLIGPYQPFNPLKGEIYSLFRHQGRHFSSVSFINFYEYYTDYLPNEFGCSNEQIDYCILVGISV
jgi:hypothetical protein